MSEPHPFYKQFAANCRRQAERDREVAEWFARQVRNTRPPQSLLEQLAANAAVARAASPHDPDVLDVPELTYGPVRNAKKTPAEDDDILDPNGDCMADNDADGEEEVENEGGYATDQLYGPGEVSTYAREQSEQDARRREAQRRLDAEQSGPYGIANAGNPFAKRYPADDPLPDSFL